MGQDLEKKSELSIYGLYFTGLIFLAYLFAFTGLNLFNFKKQKKKKEWLLNEIEKREYLINEGHYVTALELAKDYLEIFPKDTQIKAFKKRLLDYTGNDPEKAQLAFVQWKKLQSRLKNPDNGGIYLNETEKENILPLLEYHTDLKDSYLKLEYLANIKRDEIEKELDEEYNKALDYFKWGEFENGKNLLIKLKEKAPDFKKAYDFLNRLKIKPLESFKLKSLDNNIELLVFTKDKIKIGRKDEGIYPDVKFTDRRVSRNHLDIEIYFDKAMVIDHQSSAGTFINGDKVESVELNDNDLLTISKVIDFDVSIMKNQNFNSLYLNGSNLKILILRDLALFNVSGRGIEFFGEDLRIERKDGVLILSSSEDIIIPEINSEISIKGNYFKIEEIYNEKI